MTLVDNCKIGNHLDFTPKEINEHLQLTVPSLEVPQLGWPYCVRKTKSMPYVGEILSLWEKFDVKN